VGLLNVEKDRLNQETVDEYSIFRQSSLPAHHREIVTLHGITWEQFKGIEAQLKATTTMSDCHFVRDIPYVSDW